MPKYLSAEQLFALIESGEFDVDTNAESAEQSDDSNNGPDEISGQDGIQAIASASRKNELTSITDSENSSVGDSGSEYEPDDDEGSDSEENEPSASILKASNDKAPNVAQKEHPENNNFNVRGQKGKKRKKNVQNWKRNVRKQKRNIGEAYTNRGGNVVPAATIGPPCKCKQKCFAKLGAQAANVFKSFWSIGDKDLQDSVLFACCRSVPINRRRPRNGEREGTSRARKKTYKYFIKLSDGNELQVCRNALISIFGIRKKRFERIQKCAGQNLTSPRDKRGMHDQHARVDEDIKEKVRNHIRSFPKRHSHYSRERNQHRQYLHENLNIRRMWMLYLKEHEPDELEKLRCKEKVTPCVKYWLYSSIFQMDFNLSFGQPRSDTCSKCDQLHNEIGAARGKGDTVNVKDLERQLEFHHRKAEKGYQALKDLQEDAKAGRVDMLTFDFQQNLPVPTLKNSDMFYARLLWTYNFGVHNCADDTACMHIWSESEAKRGASEVCSCLDRYLGTHNPTSRHLVLFYDGCGGQNKNKIMFSFLLRLVNMKRFDRIDHYFLTRGHTFLPNDRDFGVIEKFKKYEMAYVPVDYVKIIKEARTSNPFEVVHLKRDDVLDFMAFSKTQMKTSMLKDIESNENTLIRNIMWFSYGQSEETNATTGIKYVTNHNDEIWGRCTLNDIEPWQKFKPLKRNSNLASDIVTKYSLESVKIKYAKYKDLINKVVEKGVLPDKYIEFYRQLPHDGPTEAIRNEEDSDSDPDDYVYE